MALYRKLSENICRHPRSDVMFASFHSEKIIPSSDKLNTFVSGVLIRSTISLSSFGGIHSTPGD